MQKLSPKTIGLVRKYLGGFSRGDIKQILIEAGVEAALTIPLVDRMNSNYYRTKNEILYFGFDKIYETYEKSEADGIVLEIVKIMARIYEPPHEKMPDLVSSLQNDRFPIESILGKEIPEVVKISIQRTNEIKVEEAKRLFKKAYLRMLTDPDGAVTAAMSGLEAALKFALEKASIKYSQREEPPALFTKLRKETNFEKAFSSERTQRVLKALSSLAYNLYDLAHEAGDRHSDKAWQTTPELAELFVSCSAIVTNLIFSLLERGTLKNITP